jgi:regulator of nucleoside diphosphate kinase
LATAYFYESLCEGEIDMSKKPKIIISSVDMARLDALLEPLADDAFPGKAALEEELDRAKVVPVGKVPPTVVTMNSTVRFKVESSTEEFCLSLVYPKDMDTSGKKLSVFAPVGSALLGLSEGASIDWVKPNGGKMQVRIEEVMYQPERAGDYDL